MKVAIITCYDQAEQPARPRVLRTGFAARPDGRGLYEAQFSSQVITAKLGRIVKEL